MKEVLITGVCGGMGYAAAKHLCACGYHVWGLDKASSCDLSIEYISADITNSVEIAHAFAHIEKKIAKLDALIHFAGFYTMNSLVEISECDFLKIFDVNLFGIYRVNKAFFGLLHSGSRIIVTSSELAPLDPLPFTGLYAATKAAVEKYAYTLRMELNLQGIYVSVIRPGAVNTKMLEASTDSLNDMCRNTKIYRHNANRFQSIVKSVETKNIAPQKIARIVQKALETKKPKYVYNVNRNFLLRLLNFLPDRWQVGIIKLILCGEKQEVKAAKVG